MNRILKPVTYVLAAAYFLVDAVFAGIAKPISDWIGRHLVLRKLRVWIRSLRPYPSLALFAVPVIILEPAKPLSAYLLGSGHFFAGAVVFISAEVLKLTVVERLFHLNKEKLLSIPAFQWAYQYWRQMMDLVESLEVWKASRRIIAKAGRSLRASWRQFKLARAAQRVHSNRLVRRRG